MRTELCDEERDSNDLANTPVDQRVDSGGNGLPIGHPEGHGRRHLPIDVGGDRLDVGVPFCTATVRKKQDAASRRSVAGGVPGKRDRGNHRQKNRGTPKNTQHDTLHDWRATEKLHRGRLRVPWRRFILGTRRGRCHPDLSPAETNLIRTDRV